MADFFGRRDILTANESITAENVVAEVNSALKYHIRNLVEEDELYWYRRGKQPILFRKKEIRPEINNKIVENTADEIVGFKCGYFLPKPAFYIARNDSAMDSVRQLNEWIYNSGKHDADNMVVDAFHTMGKGVLYAEPSDEFEDKPIAIYSVDPRSAFVVYSMRPGNAPVYGVNMVTVGDEIYLDVWTKERYFSLKGGSLAPKSTYGGYAATEPKYEYEAREIITERSNEIGEIPLVEYRYNNINMAAFESVMPLMDAMNTTMSDRVNGVEQFIQSLMIMKNCQLPEGMDANKIRELGLIELQSNGESNADIDILSQQLNQAETQTLVDYMYTRILSICGMPASNKGGASTSDTGVAVLARDGWYQADAVARNTEDLFKKSNRLLDKVILKILKIKKGFDLNFSDFELHFDRSETTNLLVKTQGALNLKELGFAPEIAFARSGVSNDPVNDVELSRKYIDMKWGERPTEEFEPMAKPEVKMNEEGDEE